MIITIHLLLDIKLVTLRHLKETKIFKLSGQVLIIRCHWHFCREPFLVVLGRVVPQTM